MRPHGKILDREDVQGIAVQIVLEQAARHEAQSPAAAYERQLKIFAENLGCDLDRHLKAIERLYKSRSAPAARRVQEPVLACKITEALWAAVGPGRRLGSRYDDDFLRSKIGSVHSGGHRMCIRQQSDRTFQCTAADFFDEVGGPA